MLIDRVIDRERIPGRTQLLASVFHHFATDLAVLAASVRDGIGADELTRRLRGEIAPN